MATTATIPNRSIPIATFTVGAQRFEVPLNEEWARFFRDLQVRSGGVSGVVQPPSGGTGFSSYSVGDMLYADTPTSFARLNAVTAGNALISNGVGTPPSWGTIDLAMTVSGILSEANGGTGFPAFGAGVSDWLQVPSSANLLAAVPDATGIGGGVVFADSPALTTPDLGQPIAGNLVNCVGYTAANIVGTIAVNQGGTGQVTANDGLNALLPSQATHAGKSLVTDGANTAWVAGTGGTVTSVGVSGANGIGVSGSPITASGVIALSLGAITPTSVAASGAVTGSNLSGTNTGDQTNITGNAGTATALQTARNINGVAFDGTANITVTAAAGTLSGATLAAGVTASSLTSVGTLTSLTMSGAISGATDLTITGNAILGNASTDTVNVGNGGIVKDSSGNTGIGRTPAGEILETNRALSVHGSLQSATGPKFALDYASNDSRLLAFGSGAGTPGSFSFYQASSDNSVNRTALSIDSGGQVVIQTIGKGLSLKEGSNAKMGIATLVAGTVVVSTTAVTANSRIFLTAQSLGTVTVGQGLAVSARTAGTSFTITSGNAVDTSVVGWIIFEPS